MDTYEIALLIRVQDQASGSLNNIANNFQRAQGSVNGMHGAVDTLHSKLHAINSMGNVGSQMFREAKDILGEMMTPAKEYTRQITLMNEAGLSQIDITKNIKSAWDAISIPGVTATGALEREAEFRQMLVATSHGKIDMNKANVEARELLTPLLQARTLLMSQSGSEKVADQQTSAILKFSEMRGQQSIDQIKKNAEMLSIVAIATQGQVLPTQMLQAMKFMGGLKMTADDKMLSTVLPELILEMKTSNGGGSSRAGVLMQSIGRTLGQGHMDKKLAGALEQLGLLNDGTMSTTTTNTIAGGQNPIKGFNPANPGEWVKNFLVPALEKAHPEIKGNQALTSATIMQVMSGSNVFTNAIQELANKQPAFAKLGTQESQVGGFDRAYMTAIQNDPMIAQIALKSSFDNLMTALAKGAIPVIIPLMNRLAETINQFARYSADHPEVGRILVDSIAGFGAFGLALKAISIPVEMVLGIMTIANGLKVLFTPISWLAEVIGASLSYDGLAALIGGIVAFAQLLPGIGIAAAAIGGLTFAVTHWSNILTFATDHIGLIRAAFAAFLLVTPPVLFAVKAIQFTMHHWTEITAKAQKAFNWFTDSFNGLMSTVVGWANKMPGIHIDAPHLEKQTGDWGKKTLDWLGVDDPFAGVGKPGGAPAPSQKSQPTGHTFNVGNIVIHQQPGQDAKKLAADIHHHLKKQAEQAYKSQGSAAGDLSSYGVGY